ncbi:hypothetical protein FSARC_13788, partial [Fusarium sarcochroum]
QFNHLPITAWCTFKQTLPSAVDDSKDVESYPKNTFKDRVEIEILTATVPPDKEQLEPVEDEDKWPTWCKLRPKGRLETRFGQRREFT